MSLTGLAQVVTHLDFLQMQMARMQVVRNTLTVLLYLRTSRDKEGNQVFSLGRYADMRPSISVSTGCRWQDQALTNSFSSLAVAQLENIIKIPETISNKDVDAACKRVMSYQSTM